MTNIIKIVLFFVGMILQFNIWAQTNCNCNLPIDETFQIAPMTLGHGSDVGVAPLYENNNACTPAMALPFNFCFYGRSFDSVFISNNGIVSFIKPIFSFIDSPATVPLGADTLMIAPFWADANTINNGGKVYYKITPTYMVVIWDSVKYVGVDVDGWNTFQLIITNGDDPIVPDGNNISFCYPEMQWACSDSSGGFSGYGGTAAFVGINKGDGVTYAQISTFALPGVAYYGPFSGYNGVDWLDFQSFMFNSCVTGNIIAPVIANNRPACNTLYICPCDTSATEHALGAPAQTTCDTISMFASFICAEPGQTAALSYSCTGALNICSVYTSTANIIDTIIVQAIPAFGDTGIHTLTLTATDSVHQLHSSVTYTIDVTTNCLTAGIPVPELKSSFSVYPNPAETSLHISCNKGVGKAIKIYDVLGQEVISSALSSSIYDVDISKLPKGMYFVEVSEEGIQSGVKKIVIQ